ncbi:hypothetical protein Pan153_31220 [Gimesia panareensis]|uniref:Uncharacterized protein n=1 Tax=Gimesia panareensis TaxID=2527978 RepID=A0A518FQ28_9PLAN|nr:hypothetical protein [Gimesia panareensis]QDV18464.1 hypothetical protein Pan153_31220 [Gimesia panareensis]
MLWMIPVFLVFASLVLFGSVLRAEAAWSPASDPVKTRLLLSLRRIARSQAEIADRSQRFLLLFSLTCGLLSIAFLPWYISNMLTVQEKTTGVAALITCRYAPLMYLGLFVLLQAAGHISLSLTERCSQPLTSLLLNGYFWLPLLLAFAAVGAYLPVHSEQAARGATSTIWLLLLQPAGTLALLMALTGPAILVNAREPWTVRPVQHWIREFHTFNSVFIMVLIMASLTCFAPQEKISASQSIVRFILLPVLPPILLGVHYRLIRFLKRQAGFDPEALWKQVLWLSLIAVSASFLAFHVLGMSDHYMHMLLNFSLLAIWWGFIVPRFPVRASQEHQAPEYKSAGEIRS